MSESKYPLCRNPNIGEHECHPAYAKRYDGFCSDCANAGVPDLLAERDQLRAEVAELRGYVAHHDDCPVLRLFPDNPDDPDWRPACACGLAELLKVKS